MSARNAVAVTVLVLAAAGSGWLANYLQEPEAAEARPDVAGENFYLRSARILGTGADGRLLYEIEAEYAEQYPDEEIAFQNVRIRYTTEAQIPWTLNADEARIAGETRPVVLSGHVRVVSEQGLGGEVTEIRTPYLEFDPLSFRAETDSRVQIRVGARSLTATGMLALLREDRLQLKSNVSGKFVP